ncbi:MAG: MFS transporter [Polyangiaceae bacterium]|nr:MFS transporter [Polyangiaceae bacterium]
MFALAQILPNLRREMGLDEVAGGLIVTTVSFGTVLAFLLVRMADRWGRKRILTITIAGYTAFTFLTGFSPNVWAFAGLQLVARIFLIAEWAISMVYAAEEFPARRRGMVMGVINAFASLGSIVCAGVVPFLLRAQWGWRTVYFVGIVPLVILAYARRGLRETQRFDREPDRSAGRSFFAVWRTPYRKRVLQLGLIWMLTYACTHNAVTFWKEFAVAERGLSDGEVGRTIAIAAVASMPLVFLAGKLLDAIGRRRGSIVIFGVGTTGLFCAYNLQGVWPLTVALIFGIFGAGAVLPALNAFSAELVPTHLRADAYAWANNVLGRVLGYVASPALVGLAASQVGWGSAVSATMALPIVALGFILLWLPETNARELEETARAV